MCDTCGRKSPESHVYAIRTLGQIDPRYISHTFYMGKPVSTYFFQCIIHFRRLFHCFSQMYVYWSQELCCLCVFCSYACAHIHTYMPYSRPHTQTSRKRAHMCSVLFASTRCYVPCIRCFSRCICSCFGQTLLTVYISCVLYVCMLDI